jgi:hypothetical protein
MIKIKHKDNVVKLKSDENYVTPDKTLCKLTDTGNGFIAKFPSWASCHQDKYICMDYSEADYLLISLAKATLGHNEDTLTILKAIISDIEKEEWKVLKYSEFENE